MYISPNPTQTLFFFFYILNREGPGAVPALVISTPGSPSFVISINESGCTILLQRVGEAVYPLNLSPLGVYIGNWLLKWKTTVVTAVIVTEFSSLRFLYFRERRRQRFPSRSAMSLAQHSEEFDFPKWKNSCREHNYDRSLTGG